MSDLPAPMTSPDCDLRKFPGMMVDVQRLLASTFNATASRNPLAWMIGHKLWYRSWHQIPAGSLPNDDDELCYLAELGFDLKSFRKAKDVAMRGWVLCADGRLYHPMVAETARSAWRKILEQKWRTEVARIKKHNQRHQDAVVPVPDMEGWIAGGCEPRALGSAQPSCLQGQAAAVSEDSGHASLGTMPPIEKEEIGKGIIEEDIGAFASRDVPIEAPAKALPKVRAKPWDADERFEALWNACTPLMRQRAKSKAKVWPKWQAALKDHDDAEIIIALARYLQGDPDVKRTGGPGLQVWLGDGTYEQWISGDVAAALDDETWTVAVDLWRQGRGWAASYGPEPGQPGCRAPAHLLVQTADTRGVA